MKKRINIRYQMCLFLMSFLSLLCYAKGNNGFVTLKINGETYNFETADSPEEKGKGLMFRENLDTDSGMLFIFDQDQILRFYMKNTYIPLDIAFIDSEFKILDIQEMEPLNEQTITSKYKVKYALEVNRGFFSGTGIKVGDEIEYISGENLN